MGAERTELTAPAGCLLCLLSSSGRSILLIKVQGADRQQQLGIAAGGPQGLAQGAPSRVGRRALQAGPAAAAGSAAPTPGRRVGRYGKGGRNGWLLQVQPEVCQPKKVEREAPPVPRVAGLGAAWIPSSPSAALAVRRLRGPTRCVLVAGCGWLGLRRSACWHHEGRRQALRGVRAATCCGHAVIDPLLFVLLLLLLLLQRERASLPEPIKLDSAEGSQAIARLPSKCCTGPSRAAQARGGAAAPRLPHADAAQHMRQLLLRAGCAVGSRGRRG